MQIKINVVGKIATAEGSPYIVCGNSNDTILFTFDSEWQSYAAKTARFIYEVDGEEKFTEVAFTGTTCRIPELYNIKKVEVGVYAGDTLSTTRCKINCKTSILDGEGSGEGTAHEEPGEDIYNQIVGLCNEAVTAGNEAKEAATTFEATTRATFGNALKGNLYGAVARADDVSPVEHALKVYVHGKNIIPFPYISPSKTESGITYTVGADRGITLSGTATAYTSFSVLDTTNIPAGDTLYIGLAGESENVIIQVNVLDKYNALLASASTDQSRTIDMTAYPTATRIMAEVKRGANGVETSGTVYPMISTVSAEYEPYIDPSTITVTRSGKNLIPLFSKVYSYTFRGVTHTCSATNNTITLNGTAEVGGGRTGLKVAATPFKIVKGARYTLQAKIVSGTGGELNCYISSNDNENRVIANCNGNTPVTFTAAEDVECFLGINQIEGVTYGNATIQFQLEIGDFATTMETYNGVQITPNADGTIEGIASISPCMTFSTDTTNAFINCEYNRDINAVIADLYNKITG